MDVWQFYLIIHSLIIMCACIAVTPLMIYMLSYCPMVSSNRVQSDGKFIIYGTHWFCVPGLVGIVV